MTAERLAEQQQRIPMAWSWKLRRHRAELRVAVEGLQSALAVPIDDPAWRPGVVAALWGLRRAFTTHVEFTEGPDGLYAQVLGDAPRLVNKVYTLGREHRVVLAAVDALVARLDAEPEQLRRRAGDVLHKLSRHRQRGADLVHEAYATDIGGEN